jgi:hypothetical protein
MNATLSAKGLTLNNLPVKPKAATANTAFVLNSAIEKKTTKNALLFTGREKLNKHITNHHQHNCLLFGRKRKKMPA